MSDVKRGISFDDCRAMFENSPLPMLIYDLETLNFLNVNDAAISLYGYSREEFLSMTARDIHTPDDLPTFLEIVSKMKPGFSEKHLGRHFKKDGTHLHVNVGGFPISFDGRLCELVTVTDITEIKNAEEDTRRVLSELQVEKARAESIIAAIGDGISIQDLDYKILYQNKAMRDIVGDHVGKHCYEAYEHGENVCIGCPVAMSFKDGNVHTEERSGVTDRGRVYVEVTASPLKDADGNIVGGVEVVRDITERKKIDSSLRETKESLEALIHASPIAIMTLDPEGTITLWNEAAEGIFGWRQEEVLGKQVPFVPEEKMDEFFALRDRVIRGERLRGVELRRRRKDGSAVETSLFASPTHDAKGNVTGIMALIEDITERKLTEMELSATKARLEHLLTESPAIIYSAEPTGDYGATFISENVRDALGYEPVEFLDDPRFWMSHMHPDDLPEAETVIERLLVDGHASHEYRFRHRDGAYVWLYDGMRLVSDEEGNPVEIVGYLLDITEQKQAEEELRRETVKTQGYLDVAGVLMMVLDSEGKVTLFNRKGCELLGIKEGDILGRNWFDNFLPERNREEVKNVYRDLMAGNVELREYYENPVLTAGGEERLIAWHNAVLRDDAGNIYAVLCSGEDITVSKRIESELKVRARQQAALAQFGQFAITGDDTEFLMKDAAVLVSDILGVEYCKVLELLPNGEELVLRAGVGFEENLIGSAKVDAKSSQAGYTLSSGEAVIVEDFSSETRFGIPPLLKEHDVVSGVSVVMGGREGPIGILGAHSSRRRQFSNDDVHFIEVVAAMLAEATGRNKLEKEILQSKRDWEDIFDTITDMITVHDKDFNIIRANKSAQKILGLPVLEVKKAKCFESYHGTGCPPEGCPSCQTLKTGDAASFEIFEPHLNMDMEIRAIPRFDAEGTLSGLIHVVRDISDRKKSEERIRNNIKRLESLHSIDMAISSSLDLRLTMNVILEQVTTQLQVDAADILLYSPATKTLDYSAGRGFRTTGIKKTRLRIGEGCAGGAALERNIARIPSLEEAKFYTRHRLLEGEGFVSAICAPLIAKGEVKGVLEIYNRKRLEPDADWMDFLETLATQSAIAIDNSALFNDLQRSNIEISVAYDATIEGWSRALDYRDKETEGHSQRVTEMTLRIARAMGIEESSIEHMRRGALLHDIGKLGVPDAILFKPGKLDEEEWKLMKKHPTLAYELLSPIAFLRPAIDIPYCHHEKWDGAGYPRGLKAEQIPIAARIFSVIDVWDALRSDRPYRSAWPVEKTVKYMKELSGKEFDPEVVRVFLEEMAHE